MIELIVRRDDRSPMLKEVAKRKTHTNELITRGKTHFFSIFEDPIAGP